jgi:hypothetical protein
VLCRLQQDTQVTIRLRSTSEQITQGRRVLSKLASARPTSSSRRTSGGPYWSWTAALISFGRTRRVAGSRVGARRPRRGPSARGRGSRSSPQELDAASPSQIGLVDGAVVEDECAEALALGEVARDFGTARVSVLVGDRRRSRLLFVRHFYVLFACLRRRSLLLLDDRPLLLLDY